MSDTERYLIWSHEKGAWWGPDYRGYVLNLGQAGRYSRDEALTICTGSMPGTSRILGTLPELPVREDDVLMLHQRFRGSFPHIPRETWEP